MKKNRKRREPKPRIQIKKTFPFSLTRITQELRIAPGSIEKFIEQYPPDYRKGDIRRYRCIPESAARYKIIKTAAGFAVVGVFQEPLSASLFEGTEQECYSVRAEAIKRWRSLPRGREFATVAQEILNLKELQK